MQLATATSPRKRSIFSRIGLLGLLLIVLAASALALRLNGLDWDQGNFFHPDERSIYMRADCMYLTLTDTPGWENCANLDFPLDEPGLPSPGTFFDADRSPLNPHWFPLGTILIYILVAARGVLSLLMDSVSLQDLAMVGRTLTALADTASVLVLFALGSRLYGRATGLLAAALGTFTVINIQLAHFYRPEPFIVLLTLATFWFMLNVLDRGRWRDHLWLGVMVGLSFAFKASSLYLLAPLAVTYGIMAWRTWNFYPHMVAVVAVVQITGRGLAAGGLAFLVFAVLQPYALLDFSKFFADLSWESGIARTAGQVPYTQQYVDTPLNGLYEFRQTSLWALGLPLGLAAWGGLLFTMARVWWRPRLGDVLFLAWVVPVVLTLVLFEVKFLRYIAPVLPVMVLLGSRWLVTGYGWASQRSYLLGWLATGTIAFVLFATVFYALAFSNIYRNSHPAVQAAEWVKDNVRTGTIIVTDNHWDEGFPGLGNYSVSQLPMYESDDLAKFENLSDSLAKADYLMIYSNRPFGSIARLPQRYPFSSIYYQQLFGGHLGYELERAFASYPSLLGVSFTHDPFTRAEVVAPAALHGVDDGVLTLNLGYADENVTNYDHPLVLLFRNQEHLTPDAIFERILFSDIPSPGEGLLLSDAAWDEQRSGGTWASLFHEDGLTNSVPWLIWLLLVEAITLAALPLAITTFRWLPDRGVVLARPLGLLLVAWLTWMGASVGWWSFSRTSVLASVLVLGVLSSVLFYRQRNAILQLARWNWRYLVGVEALFLVGFFAFLAIRAANPDLWHPFRGGEKPMDLAYLTAVVKSTSMPPFDPWYAGGYLNYYYFGQFIMASLIKTTGIVPAVAYNLTIPLLFSITLTTAFSIGYNLTETLRRRRYPHLPVRSTLAAGLATAMMVVVLGNLDGAGQVISGVFRWLGGGSFGTFDFWQSSRLMPGEISITEFPFWTFLFADLHAHLIAIPFTLLTLGLALNLVLSGGERQRWPARMPGMGLLAFSVGALAAINTWNVPAYALISLASGAIVLVTQQGQLHRTHLLHWAGWSALIWGIAYLAFLPFHQNYQAPFGGFRATEWRTEFWQYANIHGLMLFLIGSWLVMEVFKRWRSAPPARAFTAGARWLSNGPLLAIGAAVVFGTVIGIAGFETLGVLMVLSTVTAGLVIWWIAHRHKPDAPVQLFLLALVTVVFGIGIGVDVLVVNNDIDRMNTVFKLYLDAWVLMAIVAGAAAWSIYASGVLSNHGPAFRGWLAVVVLLALSSAVFPVLGTKARIDDRFQILPLTLDGAAYQAEATYFDPGPLDGRDNSSTPYPLASDTAALEYIRQNISGSPVFLEGVSTQYRWTPRLSKYAGLPVVVGWEFHQTQQRSEFANQVRQRTRDVNTMYRTTSPTQLAHLLVKYEVEYIYVGVTERLYYPVGGIAKFNNMLGAGLEPFYKDENVTVYRVSSGDFPAPNTGQTSALTP
jgi:YYY domain-containing protein